NSAPSTPSSARRIRNQSRIILVGRFEGAIAALIPPRAGLGSRLALDGVDGAEFVAPPGRFAWTCTEGRAARPRTPSARRPVHPKGARTRDALFSCPQRRPLNEQASPEATTARRRVRRRPVRGR